MWFPNDKFFYFSLDWECIPSIHFWKIVSFDIELMVDSFLALEKPCATFYWSLWFQVRNLLSFLLLLFYNFLWLLLIFSLVTFSIFSLTLCFRGLFMICFDIYFLVFNPFAFCCFMNI